MGARSAALGALVVLGVTACSGGAGTPRSAVTSVAPTSMVAPTSQVPTSLGTPTTVAPPLSGAGALLTRPTSPTVKPVGADAAAATSCRSLVDAGFQGYCQLLTAPSGTVAYLVEQADTGPSPTREVRALVWLRQGGNWSLALRWDGYLDTNQDKQPALRALDLAQDGDPKVVATFYDPGSGYSSESTVSGVDVVEATGAVTLHRTLDHGVARQATGGGLETWSRMGGSGSSRFTHEVIRYKDVAWRAEASEEVGADAVPRGPQSSTF